METSQTGYLYHWVPADLKGHILYPLNQLKSIYPSLYVTKAAKYQNREAVMQARLPLLDCLWNDVLHFSPVHPGKVQEALAEAGFGRKPRRYFEVDPLAKGFNATNAGIFLHQRLNLDDQQFQLEEADFRVFHAEELSSLGEIPAATLAYYREMFEQGKRPLVYLYVPHVLYQGRLDIGDVNIMEVY
ncbi:MAG TPA: hypothetical protein VJ785_09915 [Anaerolineales bacterium]|nr:hypothetical protein [Anaerolineales bacterium]